MSFTKASTGFSYELTKQPVVNMEEKEGTDSVKNNEISLELLKISNNLVQNAQTKKVTN